MPSLVHFSATKIRDLGKKGEFKPDADGYYTVVVGGMEVVNSAGQFYSGINAKELFANNALFMRRVQAGNLKAEEGHPIQEPGMNDEAYVDRALEIRETLVCAHFKEVWLDFDFGKKNPHLNAPNMIAIMAKVRPTGPYAASLQSAIDNPHENLCFSIRCFTKWEYINGKRVKVIDEIITFDRVTEPGIKGANKWDSPAFESASLYPETLVSPQLLTEALSEKSGRLSQESSKEIARSVLSRMADPNRVQASKMAIKSW